MSEEEIQPVYPSMKACHGALRIPMRVLKAAKTDGCRAFVGSRVHTLPLLHWIFANTDKANATDWNLELLKARTKREQIKASRAADEVIEKVLVSQQFRNNLSVLFQDLRRRFVATVPPRYNGRTVSECADVNEAELNDLQESALKRAEKLDT